MSRNSESIVVDYEAKSRNNESVVANCEDFNNESMVAIPEGAMSQDDENVTPQNVHRVFPKFRSFVDRDVDGFTDTEATEIMEKVARDPLTHGRVHARCWEPYCIIRNLTFSNNTKKARHIREFHGGEKNLQIFKCPVCKKFFLKRRNWMYHTRRNRHTTKRQY